MAKMTNTELVKKALDIAENYKTSYIWGGLGRPITEPNIQNAIAQYSVNSKYAAGARRYVGQAKAFFFDCVGLIKCILWGWCGDSSKSRGGAIYASNGVPDTSADGMIASCSGVSTDFSDIEVGEALWCKGHIGIYIGDGLGVECTPAWKNGVQITAVSNIGAKSGYNSRKWTKHGKLPYVNYEQPAVSRPIPPDPLAQTKPTPAAPAKPEQAVVKLDPAKSFNRIYAKSYTVTAGELNMRCGAGTAKDIIKVLKKGEKVRCYGYYTTNGSTIWLFVQDSTGQTGFCSKKYLK